MTEQATLYLRQEYQFAVARMLAEKVFEAPYRLEIIPIDEARLRVAYSVVELCFTGSYSGEFLLFMDGIVKALSLQETRDFSYWEGTFLLEESEVTKVQPKVVGKPEHSVPLTETEGSKIWMHEIIAVVKALNSVSEKRTKFNSAGRVLANINLKFQKNGLKAGFSEEVLQIILDSETWAICRRAIHKKCGDYLELPFSTEPHVFENVKVIVSKVLQEKAP